MGALFALVAARATAALKHQAFIYGLMAACGLIGIFTAGFALDAGYSTLMLRYGAATASLVLAGFLVTTAIVCLITARVIARRPSDTAVKLSELASPYRHAPMQLPYPRQTLIAVAAGLAGAATVAVALIQFPALRGFLRGRDHPLP